MRVLVTGGAGFIGSAVVKALVDRGNSVTILDNYSRGSWVNLQGLSAPVRFCHFDIRDYASVLEAMTKCDEVIHLAYINGTKTFYEHPDLVLDVGVQGILNVLKACAEHKVKRMMLMSSSEVCRAMVDGMDEATPLVIPDPFNPRYSYSAGKIISEMLAIHSGKFDWLTIIRPFNIYGPGMAAGHVIPDFIEQLKVKVRATNEDPLPFTILGSANETRSFCYIDDFVDGLMVVRDRGEHMGIYNIGTPEEVTIADLAHRLGNTYGRRLYVTQALELREGSIQRRKPDISKVAALGYQPKVSLDEGLRRVICQ